MNFEYLEFCKRRRAKSQTYRNSHIQQFTVYILDEERNSITETVVLGIVSSAAHIKLLADSERR